MWMSEMVIVKIISLLFPVMQLFGLILHFENLTEDYHFFALAVLLFAATLFLAVSFCSVQSWRVLNFSVWAAFALVMISFFVVVFGLLYEIFFRIFFPWPSCTVWFLIYLFYWRVLKSKLVNTRPSSPHVAGEGVFGR
jgi:hypothetical protein